MNKETLNKLKELAKAATKGPWMTWATTADNGNYAGLDVMTHDGGALIAEETHPCDADAHFIAAANPAAILELIALASQSLVAHTDAGGVEFPADERNDDPAEAAFWRFDARHKGYGRWKLAPQSERDAFKSEYRAALATHHPQAGSPLAAQAVPREPTEEMIRAANFQREVGGDFIDVWRTMWDAAPTSCTGNEGGEA